MRKLLLLLIFLSAPEIFISLSEIYSAPNNQANCVINTDSLTNNNYELIMTLSKKQYKEYEPVYAKFELINNDNKVFNVYDMFDSYFGSTIIQITDDKGNKWASNKIQDGAYHGPAPRYILQPGDTLLISMPINNWGEALPNSLFDQLGYFPAERKYKAIFSNGNLVSNEVGFEVVAPNEEDNNVIELEKGTHGKITREDVISTTLSHYPDNVYLEYLLADQLWRTSFHLIISDKFQGMANKTIKSYLDFFNEYPNSYCIFDDSRFMCPYFYTVFNGKQNINQVISETIDSNKGNLLSALLKYNITEFRITRIVDQMNKLIQTDSKYYKKNK